MQVLNGKLCLGLLSSTLELVPARRRFLVLAFPLCSSLLLLACASGNAASGNATRYAFKGVVKSVNVAKRQATIQHEKVGDFMEPMTMPFLIKDEAALKRLQPGDAINATLVVTNEGGQWLENISIQRTSAAR